jgi:selenide,water dikinase
LQPADDADLLVGFETSDDAAVYKMSPEIAMINTIDFITPPVDDPYWFGQISAANSISDVYSMGGRPLTALNVVMFPSGHLDMGVLREILKGGNDKVMEAGASLVGGHTVDDNEPKYGLCVNGVVHPDRIVTNIGARPGDDLILTKPLGSGVLFNAVRSGKFPYRELEKDVLPVLASLNKTAMEKALHYELHACTDITGFGILGHALEMAEGSSVRLAVEHAALPFYSGALDMYEKGVTTGSNRANRELVGRFSFVVECSLGKAEEELLYDPQTSGGLLLALPADDGRRLLKELTAQNIDAARIGSVFSGKPSLVVL